MANKPSKPAVEAMAAPLSQLTRLQLQDRTFAPCANIISSETNSKSNCASNATLICRKCKLVAYCSKECQRQHWADHKIDCNTPISKESWVPRWGQEGRHPTFLSEKTPPTQAHLGNAISCLWGHLPAMDVLKLSENEGVKYNNNIGLCFAASGDLRNILTTLANVPQTYKSQIAVTVNDHNLLLVIRNVIFLLLLAEEDADAAADAIIHFWYSSSVKGCHQKLLNLKVQKFVENVIIKTQNKPDHSLQAKTITFGKARVRIVLTKLHWVFMHKCIARFIDRDVAEKSRHDFTQTRRDYIDRRLFMIRRGLHQRQASMRCREHGLLLPFGSSSAEYTFINPTLISSDGSWMQPDSVDPLLGWSKADISSFCKNTSSQDTLENDVYGQLHFFLKHLLRTVHQKLREQPVHFNMYCMEPNELHQYVPHRSMDRIEVSNIIDGDHLNVRGTLEACEPLLSKTNKHATIIGVFVNAVQMVEHTHRKTTFADKGVANSTMGFLKVPQSTLTESPSSPVFLRMVWAMTMFTPFDRWFTEFENRTRMSSVAHEYGLKMKQKHTIIAKWPYRMTKKFGQKGAQEEFDYLLASGLSGFDRYVEWSRI